MRRVFIAAVAAGAISAPAISEAHFTPSCKKNKCKRHVVKPFNDKLDRIHNCEARHVGWFSDGLFDGGLQFHPSTWNATGSKYKFAFLAPILEQKYRGVIWYFKIGGTWITTAGWPICGHR